MCGVALDGLDEVGDQVGAALELNINRRFALVRFVAETHESVVGDHKPEQDHDDDHGDQDQQDVHWVRVPLWIRMVMMARSGLRLGPS